MVPSVKKVLPKHWLLLFMNRKSAKVLCVLVAQSRLTLCNLMYCSLPGSSVCGILQIRILEWVTISYSRESSRPRYWTRISCIAAGFFTIWAIRKARWIIVTSREKSTSGSIRPLECVCWQWVGGGKEESSIKLIWSWCGFELYFSCNII